MAIGTELNEHVAHLYRGFNLTVKTVTGRPLPNSEFWDQRFMNSLPPSQQLIFAGLLGLSSPEEYYLLQYGGEGVVPHKEQRYQYARNILREYTGIEAMANYRLYPDNPYPSRDIQYEEDPLKRYLKANFFPNEVHGLPEFLGRRSQLDNEFISFDQRLRDKLHPYFKHHSEELIQIADELMETHPPLPSKEVLDTIRFLGCSNEVEFIRTTENQLLSEVAEFISQSDAEVETSIGYLREAMEFSKESDLVRAKKDEERGKPPERQGKRRTGESYYCHPLTTMWFYWNIVKPDITSGAITIEEVIRDLKALALHDTLEDLDHDVHHTMEGDIIDIVIRDLGKIRVSREEFTLIDRLTKREHSHKWFETIQSAPEEVRRSVALCKSADRFANLLTIPYTGEPYFKVLGKLWETVLVGGHLQRIALGLYSGTYTDKYQRVRQLREQDRFALLGMIPIMALSQMRALKVQFGNAYFDHLSSMAGVDINDDRYTEKQLQNRIDAGAPRWLVRMMNIIKNEVHDDDEQFLHNLAAIHTGWSEELLQKYDRLPQSYTNRNRFPGWFKKAAYLFEHYGTNHNRARKVQPVDTIERVTIANYVSLLRSMSQHDETNLPKLLTVDDFIPLVTNQLAEYGSNTIARSVLPGSKGSILLPTKRGHVLEEVTAEMVSDAIAGIHRLLH